MSGRGVEIDPEAVLPPYVFDLYRVAVNEALQSAATSFLAYGEVIECGGSDAEAARLLHDALTHSAAVARFFWPTRKAGMLGEYRANKLRLLYKVDESSALFNRDLRNELEHFDEKIDKWFASGPVGPVVASPVFADHSIGDDEFGHAFKIVDSENDIYVVLGRKYEFGSICREIVRLLTQNEE